ncbi:MmgE/PrpD family protein [Sporosarcina ureilytica]|uniref:2-methylcitrate dehydratase n=1 Tax=Sporosarcina ureilytica TaxID=298596 RepID=A0A1D8JFD3_9BACL|nr:MmgE/PrpD family protein [Sporosarcina ureilytica]AOV07424.1 hypothetical protein BI350_07645 [Sporosarcina ureilytica]
METLSQKLMDETWDSVHLNTLESAKKVLIDTLGATIAGVYEPSMKKLIEQVEVLHPGSYAVLGTDKLVDLYTAALINGAATVAVELDEGNQWSKGHPAAHVVPTMLTYVQTKDRYSGKDFIFNLIRAYEACSQFGRATTLCPTAHAHGTWGVMGAAASVLMIDDVTKEEFLAGINISASFAMPTMWNSAIEGALIRDIYVGQAVESGIKTVSLLKSGFYAPRNNVEYIYGEVIGNAFDKSSFCTSTSGRWDIDQNYFKTHAFCRYAHAPLDVLKLIVEENAIQVDDIKSIQVVTYSRAASLNSSEYINALSAKFSIPYALSVWLHTKQTNHSVFNIDFIENLQIRETAKKIKVIQSTELEKDYPNHMPAEVEVILQSGKSFKNKLNNAYGAPGHQLTFADVIEKFKVNTKSQLSASIQKEIINWISTIESQSNMDELIQLLRQK